ADGPALAAAEHGNIVERDAVAQHRVAGTPRAAVPVQQGIPAVDPPDAPDIGYPQWRDQPEAQAGGGAQPGALLVPLRSVVLERPRARGDPAVRAGKHLDVPEVDAPEIGWVD